MPTTAGLALPYPALTAAPNVPADLQALADRLEALFAATQTAWATTWTPTWANLTVGNGTSSYRFKQIGKTVWFSLRFTLGTTSLMGTAPTFTLPVTAQAATTVQGQATYSDVSASQAIHWHAFASSTTVMSLLMPPTSAGAYSATPTSVTPFSWATGDIITVTGTYEAA